MTIPRCTSEYVLQIEIGENVQLKSKYIYFLPKECTDNNHNGENTYTNAAIEETKYVEVC